MLRNFLRVSSTPSLTPSSLFTSSLYRSMSTGRTPPAVFVTGKLASQLFKDSKSSSNLPQVRRDMKLFRDAYEKTSDLRALFLNPLTSDEKRNVALGQVFKSIKIESKEAQAFIKAAASTKNLGKIKQIVNDFDKLVTYELKEVHATVTSAEALQPAHLKRLEGALKSKINSDESLIVHTNVDPTILGGLIVQLDQQMLDLSVTNHIRKLDAAIRA